MGIYLPNMEMPTDYPLWIVVSADGTVQYNYFSEWKTAEEKAVPVPPHGRCIDADALMNRMWEETDCMVSVPATFVRDAPTIITPEEG